MFDLFNENNRQRLFNNLIFYFYYTTIVLRYSAAEMKVLLFIAYFACYSHW